MEHNEPVAPLLEILGRQLKADGYNFVTPTPITHARVLKRTAKSGDPLRDAFGWNREVEPNILPAAYHGFLRHPALFDRTPDGYRSRVRFSSLGRLLIAHSGYPTSEPDAVFFGPDTYRFAGAITALKERDPAFQPHRIIDIGTGSGAGGLFAAQLFPSLRDIVLCDINPRALEFARANAAINETANTTGCISDILREIEAPADLIISNPPYLIDAAKRAYRHGGGEWGDHLAVDILSQALAKLTPNGQLLLYTGSPIVDGQDKFLEAALPILNARTRAHRYDETDPDVFGEELEFPPYNRADRIATTVLHVSGKDILG